MTDPVFAEGIFWNEKHVNAPAHILGSISIRPDDFIVFLSKQEVSEKGYVRLTVKMSKAGKPYVELDTWKPGMTAEAHRMTQEPPKPEMPVYGPDGEEVPF